MKQIHMLVHTSFWHNLKIEHLAIWLGVGMEKNTW